MATTDAHHLQRCCVCFAEGDEIKCGIVQCDEGHVTCDECFELHVKTETQKASGCVAFVFL